jgi:hypothetical protein
LRFYIPSGIVTIKAMPDLRHKQRFRHSLRSWQIIREPDLKGAT